MTTYRPHKVVEEPVPVGQIVQVGRTLYQVEAHRPAKTSGRIATTRGWSPILAGKTVYTLRRISDDSRWRTTTHVLHNKVALLPTQARVCTHSAVRPRGQR